MKRKRTTAPMKRRYTLSLILNNSLKQSDGLTGNGAIISHTKIARFVFDSSIEFWCVQWIILEATLPLLLLQHTHTNAPILASHWEISLLYSHLTPATSFVHYSVCADIFVYEPIDNLHPKLVSWHAHFRGHTMTRLNTRR